MVNEDDLTTKNTKVSQREKKISAWCTLRKTFNLCGKLTTKNTKVSQREKEDFSLASFAENFGTLR